MTQAENLNVQTLPLRGRHLIEASAGTGKTFNITRLYLRLLLEKSLTVKEILVMTFTNAATEEIRGRIAATLREALSYWRKKEAGEEAEADPIVEALYARHSGAAGRRILEAALLELDDASVFTIHGFCNRVLSQLAFDTGASLNVQLETQTRDFYLKATQDWVRLIANDEQAYHLLTAQGWHDPHQFLARFGSAIYSGLTPRVPDENQRQQDAEHARELARQGLNSEFTEIRDALLAEEPLITDTLIHGKKDAAARQEEWATLLLWLSTKDVTPAPDAVSKFTNGNRYRGNDTLKTVFAPLKALMAETKKVSQQLTDDAAQQSEQAPALALAASGIAYIREHVMRQKNRAGVLGFDDLIATLADALRGDNPALTAQLRALYPVALIDEFQDTDKDQYDILSALYPKNSDDQVLMMIGDPKQAIYGFRGGDIFTYLEAGRNADYRWVMDTNWRSTEDMISAYNRLFYGRELDNDAADVFGFGIRYSPVKPSPAAKAALTDPSDDRRALNYVYLPEDDNSAAKRNYQMALASWMTGEISRLLSEATLDGRPVRPSDIAILVRSAPEAAFLQAMLRKQGLGAVFMSDKTNLFMSPQAQDIYRVLDGIWHQEDIRRLSAGLSSPLFGLTHQALIDLLHHEDDATWDSLMDRVSLLRQIWVQRGVMSLILSMMQSSYHDEGGHTERSLTNYLHLAEVLEQQAGRTAHEEQLLIWLHRQISFPDEADEQVQRLESDAKLIQLVTQHGSKGLEYPVVFVPFANDYRDPAKAGSGWQMQYRYYDEQAQALAMQLGRTSAAVARVREEGDAEATRLLYVAVTRAAHRCYLGMAPFKDSEKSALNRALTENNRLPLDEAFVALKQTGPTHTAILDAQQLPVAMSNRPDDDTMPALALRQFTGSVEEAWRLYSFSALARRQLVVSQTRRESEAPDPVDDIIASAGQADAFRFTFEKGASAGNLLHDLLEHTDFVAPDWAHAGQTLTTAFGLSEADSQALYDWLDDVLAAPLSQGSALSLGQLSMSNTLREAEFYFPMDATRWASLRHILKTHREGVSEEGQALAVPDLSLSQLDGMMHGFIDLIFCHEGKYYVADYKSTHLGDTYRDYRSSALCRNNQSHLYDLQYLIYAVALHRYLAGRIADYSPQAHFGGVYYLYLRGMHPGNNACEGVFYTDIDARLLEKLDTVFSEKRIAGEPA